MSSIPVVTAAGQGALAGTPSAVPYIDATGVRLASDAAALAWDATNTELDVIGEGLNNATVYAEATEANGIAVWGEAPGADAIGVEGRANGAGGVAVVGKAGAGVGVRGQVTTSGGIGLHGDTTHTGGIPLKLTAPTSQSANLITATVNNVTKFVVNALGGILSTYLDLPEASAPANPAASTQRIYAKSSDNRLYRRDSSGVETALDLGGSIAATQVPYGSGTNALTGSANLVYTGGSLSNTVVSGGASAVAGTGDTGDGGNFAATGAAGRGVYAAASGAGGKAVVAEAGATTVIPLQGLAPTSQTADLLQLQVNSSTKFAVGASGRPRFVSSPPANAGDTGAAGEIAWDSGFLYVAVATDTWKRVAIATWP